MSAGELYTSNAAYLPAAFFDGRANLLQVARNWILSFFGNLAGSLLVVWLIDEVGPSSLELCHTTSVCL